MFELSIMLCRYLFLFYMVYFLYNGIKYILCKKDILYTDESLCLSKQRITIIFMHITGFLILSYIKGTYKFHIPTLFFSAAALLFFIIANISLGKLYKNSSLLLWNIVFFIIDISLMSLYRLNISLAQKQLVWFFCGFLAILFLPLIAKILKNLYIFKYIYLVIGLVLLVITLFFGNTEGGATNWLTIGGFTFQPSEPVKLCFVFYLASALPNKTKEKIFNKNIFKQLLPPTIVTAVFILFFVFQRDLGDALIFFMTFITMLYIATSSITLFTFGVSVMAAASFIAYYLFSHVKTRVDVWLNPWSDISGGGYQIAQSLFAIGSGDLLGSGLTNGSSNSIPVVEKDFIFSAICEEFGNLFAIGLIFVFIMLFYCGLNASLTSKKTFSVLLAASVTNLLAFQTFLIIGGVTKLIPLTGVTLPFVSYGGSSVLVSFISIAILQCIHIKNKFQGELYHY